MGDTEQVAVDVAPQQAASTAPLGAAVPDETALPMSEVDKRIGRVAAEARRAEAAEWQAKLNQQLAERDQELEKLRAAQKEREEAELTELQLAQKRAEEAESRVKASSDEVKRLVAEAQAAQRRGDISAAIAGSTVRVPRAYQGRVFDALMQAEAVTQETVDTELTAAHGDWQADIAAYAPPVAAAAPQPTPRNVGAALSPPNSPQPADVSEADRQAALAELVARAQKGDLEAGAALDSMYGQKPIQLR